MGSRPFLAHQKESESVLPRQVGDSSPELFLPCSISKGTGLYLGEVSEKSGSLPVPIFLIEGCHDVHAAGPDREVGEYAAPHSSPAASPSSFDVSQSHRIPNNRQTTAGLKLVFLNVAVKKISRNNMMMNKKQFGAP